MKPTATKKIAGFTLIELMIVVAVIGVLASVAVPQYQKYVERAALGSALATASALKTNYEDYVAINGTEPNDKNDINANTFSLGEISVISGAISILLNEGPANGSTVTLTRNGGAWVCSISSATGVIINGCGAPNDE